jgi:hypothetical protein
MSKLNCPFCGSPPIITDYYIGCEQCNIYFDFENEESKQKAISKWETRIGEERYIDRLEKTNNSLNIIHKELSKNNPSETLRLLDEEMFTLRHGIKKLKKK